MNTPRRLAVAPPESLEVDELLVRKYQPSDAAALVDTVTQSIDHLRPWMPWIKFEPQSVEQRRDLIEKWNIEWRERTDFVMGIFVDDVVVGGTGFHLRGDDGTIEIGYWVGVGHIGQGIATRATRALTAVAFGIDDIDVVRIGHDINNISSASIPAKLGFVVVDEHAREPEAPGEAGVVRYWEMTRTRWVTEATKN